MKYKILTNDNPDKLSQEVEKYLEEGWELLGGVSVSISETEDILNEVFAQAITYTEWKDSTL